MFMEINTGVDARVAGAEAVDAADLGVRYSSFRSLDRFDEQLDGIKFGMISWPGGALAEADWDRFGFQHDGLYNPTLGQPGLSEMMSFAIDHDAGLSIVLPTVRYAGDLDQMRADVQGFMEDLLTGHYGALPKQMIFHIGSEHYHHFNALFGSEGPAEYGTVASAMVHEINAALNDPVLNPSGVDIEVSVQAGRTLAEDEDIRDAFSPEDLASVDLVMHHRYPGTAEGVDYTLGQFEPIYAAWEADVQGAGGDRPELHLSEWGTASLTRSEGLTKYIRDMAADGITVTRGDVDLEGRTTTEFEQYWQDLLATRDYGLEQPRLYLEVFSEYQATGMGAASLHAFDMVHAGRATYVDQSGDAVQFIGADLIDMLYESVDGLTVMDISTENTRSSDLWTYGFENDDRTVLFLSADDDAHVGEVTLDIEGLDEGYSAIWVESLTGTVPDDWMTRYGIPDNAAVDEASEGRTFMEGVRTDLPFTIDGTELRLNIANPGETVRIVIAHSPEEAAEVAEWAGNPEMLFIDGVEETAPDFEESMGPASDIPPEGGLTKEISTIACAGMSRPGDVAEVLDGANPMAHMMVPPTKDTTMQSADANQIDVAEVLDDANPMAHMMLPPTEDTTMQSADANQIDEDEEQGTVSEDLSGLISMAGNSAAAMMLLAVAGGFF